MRSCHRVRRGAAGLVPVGLLRLVAGRRLQLIAPRIEVGDGHLELDERRHRAGAEQRAADVEHDVVGGPKRPSSTIVRLR